MTDPGAGRPLAGKTALVTGAASGIGRAVVVRLRSDGAEVVGFDRDAAGLASLGEELGDGFSAVVGDVREPDDLAGAVAAATARRDGLDVLVANAGVYDGNLPLASIPADRLVGAWRSIYEVNVLGQLHAVRAAVEELRRRRGAIVLTSSHSAANPGVGGGALYASSKAAISGLTRQLAHELAPEIRVNAVAPGGTITALRVVAELVDICGRSENFDDPERISAAIAEATPLGFVASPEDHAVLYALLASEATRTLTGVVLASDGGTDVRGSVTGRRV